MLKHLPPSLPKYRLTFLLWLWQYLRLQATRSRRSLTPPRRAVTTWSLPPHQPQPPIPHRPWLLIWGQW